MFGTSLSFLLFVRVTYMVACSEGFIPTLYLSDVILKHPEKKFLPGDKIGKFRF